MEYGARCGRHAIGLETGLFSDSVFQDILETVIIYFLDFHLYAIMTDLI